MIPSGITAIIFFVGCAIGWLLRMYCEAEAKRDEQIIDEALTKAYQAGWRAKHNKSDRT